MKFDYFLCNYRTIMKTETPSNINRKMQMTITKSSIPNSFEQNSYLDAVIIF